MQDENQAKEKHHLIDNDEYEKTLIDAVWYNKQMPKRRKNADWSIGMKQTRRMMAANKETEAEDSKENQQVSLDSVKSFLLEIEDLYS